MGGKEKATTAAAMGASFGRSAAKQAASKIGSALGVEGASKAVEASVNHYTIGEKSMSDSAPGGEATPGLSDGTDTSDDRGDNGRNGEGTGGI